MGASALDKFKLLLWKNGIIQLRHPWQTVFEFMVPILVCLLPIIMRYVVDVEVFRQNIHYAPQSISNFTIEVDHPVLAYSPSNEVLKKLVDGVASELGLTVHEETDSSSLEKYAVHMRPFASIEFNDSYHVS